MSNYAGRYRLTGSGASAREGPCLFQFDEQNFTLIPKSAAPLSLDLADIDWLRAGDFEIRAGFYSGEELTLSHIGKVFTECAEVLQAAWRQRVVQALLLSDLPLVDTFRGSLRPQGTGADQACEIRVYEGGLAVLPDAAPPFHLRMSNIDSVAFDQDSWEVCVAARHGNFAFGRLAKRTDLFRNTLEQALARLRALSAAALRQLFPVLSLAQSEKLGSLWREGGIVSCACLEAIDPRLWPMLLERAVGRTHRPYADHLASLSDPSFTHVSFRRIRPENNEEAPSDGGGAPGSEEMDRLAEGGAGEEEASASEEPKATQDQDQDQDQQEPELPMIFSFFYPIVTQGREPANLVAQEVTSRGGRATYWFRLLTAGPSGSKAAWLQEHLPAALQQLNDALALLNFRREPIYLPEEKIYAHPRFRRYAVALRRIPELRAVREQFAGRSIHSSLDAWKKQVAARLAQPSW